MIQLTEDQKEQVQEKSRLLTEEFVQANKSILFDIKKVTNKGTEIRKALEQLNYDNAKIKMLVYETFLADVEKVKAFLGEYADAVIVSHDERLGNYYYSIGVNDDNKVFVTYPYGKEDFTDYHNYVEIDGRKYQKYIEYELEIYADGYDTEHHQNFENMFIDLDVVQMFEIAVQDYISYHKKEEQESNC